MKNLIILLLFSLCACHRGDTKSPCSVLADMTIENETLCSDLNAMQFVWLEGEGDIDPLPTETRSSQNEVSKQSWRKIFGEKLLIVSSILLCYIFGYILYRVLRG